MLCLKKRLVAGALSALIVLTGCRDAVRKVEVAQKTLTIEFTADRVIPSGAELRVRLVEISGPDRRALVNTTVPLGENQSTVTVNYNPALVQEAHDYILEVTAVLNGKTLATSAGETLMLTKGRGSEAKVQLR